MVYERKKKLKVQNIFFLRDVTENRIEAHPDFRATACRDLDQLFMNNFEKPI